MQVHKKQLGLVLLELMSNVALPVGAEELSGQLLKYLKSFRSKYVAPGR